MRRWVAIGVAAVMLASPAPAAAPIAEQPNIVFILADDLSWDLVNPQFTPHIAALQRRGVTFDRYFVSNSLCCPSRATILTGDFPHDTKVLSNTAPLGGYARFRERRLAQRTFAVALQRQGYATSLLGKYLNGYGDAFMSRVSAPVPPGWSDWHVANRTGYREFGTELNDNGTFNTYEGYGVDVLADHATAFIDQTTRPFALEIATFAPHEPYTPAPRNADDFPGLTQPRDPSFDAQNEEPPTWLGERAPLGAEQIAALDEDFRKRAQAVESVDALVARVERAVPPNTYIVFSSDNGYHMGQHRLAAGKMTAFDTDIRVPLIVAGPGVPRGRTVHQVAQNTDLYPTFVQLAGGLPNPKIDGHSLVPLLRAGPPPPAWPTLALVEHRGPKLGIGDPDIQSDHPTAYTALRMTNPDAVYVEYVDGEREYYDIASDPFELHNIASRLPAPRLAELHARLTRLRNCHDAATCWSAAL